jgi:hypothetical protein
VTIKQAIELFRSHQAVHIRQKTQDSYRYLMKFYYLSHIEELPFNHINRYKERAVAV